MTHTDYPSMSTPHGELGQTMVEYGLLVSVISLALIVVLSVGGFGGALAAQWTTIVAAFAF